MAESKVLSVRKYRKIFQELNDFFYKQERINIVIEDAMETEEYAKFVERIKRALRKQFKVYTDPKEIQKIINSVNKVDDSAVILAVAAALILFSDALSGGSDTLLTFLMWAGTLGGIAALTQMSAGDLTFYPKSDESKQIIEDRLNFLLIQLDDTTINFIADIIIDGLAGEMTAVEIASIVSDKMEDTIGRRADVIAETELATMIGHFQYETYLKNGALQHRWITARDEATCPICSANEKEGWIPITKEFQSGVAYPPAHPLCRCYTEPDLAVSENVWRG